jgi:endonuclease III
MKDSKDYSKKVQSLYRILKRKYPSVQKTAYDEPVDALVYATISAALSEQDTQSAIVRFTDYFADWNDLRTSRVEEITEVVGRDNPAAREIASALVSILRAVFSKYNMVSLKALSKMSKKPARAILEKIAGTSRFAVDYCMLTSLQGHAIPLTKKMVEYLKSNRLVHAEADEQEIEGFLARQISAENAYEFYYLLRCESEAREVKGKKRTARKEKRKAKK